jgi:hypothetical protein
MNSFLLPRFFVLYRALPEQVRQQVQQAPTKPSLPVPTLQSADRIVIPAGWEIE